MQYEYMDESKIFPDLICSICREVFVKPVVTECDHTFCSKCILPWLKQDHTCPMCRKRITNKTFSNANLIILNLLQNLQVKCRLCRQANISRELFDQHLENVCGNTTIHCKSKQFGCTWFDQRQNLNEHLKTCKYFKYEPIIEQIQEQNLKLQKQINQLTTQTNSYRCTQKWELQSINDRYEKGKVKANIQIQNACKKTMIQSQKLNALQKKISEIEDFVLHSGNIDSQNKLDQLMDEFEFLQHLPPRYENAQLETYINQRESHSWIDLSNRSLIDHDMQIIIQQAIINKQCTELDLRRNYINSHGIQILSEQLSKTQTLESLYLSFNLIFDEGIFFLSISIPFLSKLVLDSTGITDKGVIYLTQILNTYTKLIHLSLDNNQITTKGFQLIAESLINSNRSLKELYLNGNRFIDNQSIPILRTLLETNSILTILSMKNCGLTNHAKELEGSLLSCKIEQIYF